MNNKKIDFKKLLTLFLDVSALTILVFAGKITEVMMRNLPPCGIFKSFGIKCLTCGGTRCVNALSCGEICKAFRYNAFVFIAIIALFILLLFLNLAWIWRVSWAEELLKRLCNLKIVIVLSVLTALYAFLRNAIPILCKIL